MLKIKSIKIKTKMDENQLNHLRFFKVSFNKRKIFLEKINDFKTCKYFKEEMHTFTNQYLSCTTLV